MRDLVQWIRAAVLGVSPNKESTAASATLLYDELFEVDTLRIAGQNFYSIIRLPNDRFNYRPLFSTAAENLNKLHVMCIPTTTKEKGGWVGKKKIKSPRKPPPNERSSSSVVRARETLPM